MNANLCIGFFFAVMLSFGFNERQVINKIDSINNLASSHYKTNDMKQSFNYLLNNVKLSDSINDNYGNAHANYLLGNLYRKLGFPKEALVCYTNMLCKAKIIDDNYLIASSYLSLGDLIKSKSIDSALQYYKNSLKYALLGNVFDENNVDKKQSILFDVRMKMSHIYLLNNQYNDVYMTLLAAEKYVENNSYSKAYLAYTYGLYYSKINSFNIANKYFSQSLVYLKQNKDNSVKFDLLTNKVYKEFSSSLANLGKVDEAYQYLLKHDQIREKLLTNEKLNEAKNAQSKYFITEYKNIAQAATKERLLQEKIANKIKIVTFIISIAIVVLLVLLLILIKSYRSKKRLSVILKERNKLLHIAKDQAEKSSKLKSDFLSNVTHELRTPLYGVVGLTSLMLEKNTLEEEDKKLLESLKYSGDYLLNLVNDILQIGKMEAEKLELKNARVNLKETIGSIVGSFDYRLKESNNQIHVLIDHSIPEYVVCDSVRLSQVLINLIGNSIKFTNNGKIWLRVIVNDISENHADIRFEIEDNGSGIPEHKQESIFENFSQLDENQNVNYQGSGLGLSIVKKIVEMFNSKIELISEVGKGSTFSFNVRFEIDKSIDVKIENKKSGKIVALNEGYRILVAEDNKINQIVTKNLLKKANFQCDVVENGLECVKAMRTNKYDLILMDINMPIMDGNKATQEIRKENSEIPIIALTAADIEEVKSNFDTIGYNGIITKPFDNCEFFQVINSQLHTIHNLNENTNSLTKVS